MGCIQSSERPEDLSPASAAGDEVYVYVPGFRTPKYVDLKGKLQGSISADLAARLHLLRSQVLIASKDNMLASKSRRKKPHSGSVFSSYQTFKSFVFKSLLLHLEVFILFYFILGNICTLSSTACEIASPQVRCRKS